MMKHFALFLFLTTTIFWGATGHAQDQHFTQFYAAPLSFNPALSGAFNGSYRLGIIYRDQWRGVLDAPIVSYAASVDMRFGLSTRRRRTRDAVGGGVIFYSDKFSPIGFSTNQISVSGAFHKSLSGEGDQFLSLGGQIGIAQRNINYENITFGDQFNGSNGYSEPSGELLPENNFSFGDLAVGINYTLAPARRTAVFAGVALHHILEPQVSFFFDPDREEEDNIGDNTLLRKLTAHLTLQIPLSEDIQLLPRALVYKQGPHMALNAGANFRFLLNEFSGLAMHLGGWIRPVSDENNSFKPETAVLMTGIEISNFLVGFSYDANINDFNATGSRRNSFEISIAYLGNYDNETVLCPKF